MDFKVDIRNGKKLWLKQNEYENGVKYALENNITSLFLTHDETEKYYTIDFSWLKEISEIDTLEFMIPLTKNSNIESIYQLKKLKSIAYLSKNYDRLPLNHAKLKSLEYLYTCYSKNHKNKESCFEALENLKELKLWHIKDEEDCVFIGNLQNLKRLQITWSKSLKALNGIENYKLLESISLKNLPQLENVITLSGLENLKGIWIENCKKINKDGIKIIENINNRK